MLNKNQITGQALCELRDFIKKADYIEVTPKFIISLENEKSKLLKIRNDLRIQHLDIENQIIKINGIIDGIEYIQNLGDKEQ